MPNFVLANPACWVVVGGGCVPYDERRSPARINRVVPSPAIGETQTPYIRL